MPFPLGEEEGEAQASVVQLVELPLTYNVYPPFVVFISGVFSGTCPLLCTSFTLVQCGVWVV